MAISHAQRIERYRESLNTRSRSAKTRIRRSIGATPYTLQSASERQLDAAIKKYSTMVNKRAERLEAAGLTTAPAYKGLKTKLANAIDGSQKGMYAKGVGYKGTRELPIETYVTAKPRFSTSPSKYGSVEEKRKAAEYLERWLFTYRSSSVSEAKKLDTENIPKSLERIFKDYNQDYKDVLSDYTKDDIKAILEQDGVNAFIKQYGWSSYWDLVADASANGKTQEEVDRDLQKLIEHNISMDLISKRTVLHNVDDFIRRYEQINGGFSMKHSE